MPKLKNKSLVVNLERSLIILLISNKMENQKLNQIAFVDTYSEKTGDETEYLKIMLNYIYENIEIVADINKQESIANYFGDLNYAQCIEKI